jgi:hypothetical protein
MRHTTAKTLSAVATNLQQRVDFAVPVVDGGRFDSRSPSDIAGAA